MPPWCSSCQCLIKSQPWRWNGDGWLENSRKQELLNPHVSQLHVLHCGMFLQDKRSLPETPVAEPMNGWISAWSTLLESWACPLLAGKHCSVLQLLWLWGRTGKLPSDEQARARTSQTGLPVQENKQKKESQVFMLEVGFFWLCPGEKAIYHPDLGTDECQGQGKYSTTAQERLDVLWAFTPLPLAPCLPFSSLLLHSCSNSRARRKNHKKSNVRPLCNRFLGEAQSKGLARNLHPLHSWAESHFRKHSFSKLWVFVSVEYEEHSHPLTKIPSCSEESYMTNACLLCLEAAWLQATSYEQRFIASRSK